MLGLTLEKNGHGHIIIKHAGEELHLHLDRTIGKRRARVGFDGPQSFRVIRAKLLDREHQEPEQVG